MKAGLFNLELSKTLIMGIINVSYNSFYEGGYKRMDDAIAYALALVKDGANIIDIGGESTRPGSDPVDSESEIKLVIPFIKKLAHMVDVPISIDTYKSVVAEKALQAGASIINDVTGLADDNMIYVAKKYDCPVVIMHMKGNPKTMQINPEYNNVVNDVCHFFRERIKRVKFKGVRKIILDPGIGFGKSAKHNLQLLKNLKIFKELKYPLLVGVSRKSFIGMITNAEVRDRLPGSISAGLAALLNGANILRVHDVKETKQAIQIMEAIRDVDDARI